MEKAVSMYAVKWFKVCVWGGFNKGMTQDHSVPRRTCLKFHQITGSPSLYDTVALHRGAAGRGYDDSKGPAIEGERHF